MDADTPLNDTVPANNGSAWIPETLATAVGAGPHNITAADAPSLPIPAYYNEATAAANGDSPLVRVSLSLSFDLYICAGVRPAPSAGNFGTTPLDSQYTILAMAPPADGSSASWAWSTFGSFDGSFHFDDSDPGYGIVNGPAGSQWDQTVRGATLNPNYGSALDAWMNGDWL